MTTPTNTATDLIAQLSNLRSQHPAARRAMDLVANACSPEWHKARHAYGALCAQEEQLIAALGMLPRWSLTLQQEQMIFGAARRYHEAAAR